MTGRTWVIAPDSDSLKRRWKRLIEEKDATEKAKLFHPHEGGDRTVTRLVRELLAGHPHPPLSVDDDNGKGATPIPFAFRSFDRQWLLPDNRLINRANPTLWKAHSGKQIYLTAPHDRTPTTGPALTTAAVVPDLHHYHGRGGRVLPLWSNAEATQPNLSIWLLAELATAYGREVKPEEIAAYIAAIAAHPGYIERFRVHLKQPGLRIPLTATVTFFDEAVAIGREVIWLQTFGERFAEGRPAGTPKVDKSGPTIPADGTLPTTLDAMPHDLEYDAAKRRLKIGAGYVANVSPEVWAYEVSGKVVLRQWWSYRRKDRSKPAMGDKRPPSHLGDIKPDIWPAEYTTELLNVLRVLTRLVALEPAQDELLGRIVTGPMIDADALMGAGALSDSSAVAEVVGESDEGEESV